MGINASGFRLSTYSSGVLSNCTNTSMNHAVEAVGYYNDVSEPYLVVKNSWGTDWGQGGYVYLSSSDTINGGKGSCGVLQDIDYPGTTVAWPK